MATPAMSCLQEILRKDKDEPLSLDHYLSYSLNSVEEGGYIGDYIGEHDRGDLVYCSFKV